MPTTNESAKGERMDAPEVVSALSWLSVIHKAKLIGGFLVAIGVAAEFVGDWIARPFEKTVNDARELELAQLNNETARLRAREPFVNDALLANSLAGRANALASHQMLVTAEILAFTQGMREKEQLSEAARSVFILSKVKPFAGKHFDAVVTSGGIGLTVLLQSLTSALKSAGWIEVERTGDGMAQQQDGIDGVALVNIHVDESKISELWGAAEALASALKAEGIEALAERTSKPENSNSNVIHILIRPKGQ
jgi:hypothetical protein